MHDLPRQKLRELILKYGDSLSRDWHRCEALLLDLCGNYKGEITILITVQKEGVATEILESHNSQPLETLLKELTQRLQNNFYYSEEVARWAVESWAIALGMMASTEDELEKEPSKLLDQYIFLDEFFFLDTEDALPGALLPNIPENLKFRRHKITPLIPLNPNLLEYFTPEELIGTDNQPGKFKFEAINDGKGVRISIDTSPHFTPPPPKEYNLDASNVRYQIPLIELWPNSRAERWQQYHALYYQVSERDAFQIKFSQTIENSRIKYPHNGRVYHLAQLNKFPSCIECFDQAGQPLGIILLKTSEITEEEAKNLRLQVTAVEKPKDALDFFECYIAFLSLWETSRQL